MKKMIIWLVTGLLLTLSIWLMTYVKVNYDLKAYLPQDEPLVEGIHLHDDLFGKSSYLNLLILDENMGEVLRIENELKSITHVVGIEYVDTLFNPITFEVMSQSLDEPSKLALAEGISTYMGFGLSYTEAFYQVIVQANHPATAPLIDQSLTYINGDAHKLTITFDITSTDKAMDDVIHDIEILLKDSAIDYTLVGGVMSERFVRNAIESEVLKITLFLIPLILVILFLMTPSFADILLFLVVSGVAIVINLGTNALLPNISFITQSMAIALQLAISLDYMIFMVHRYHVEREKEDVKKSISNMLKHVKTPVIASAVTTAVSFLALIFMRFTIGFDIGIVFMKGVLLSTLSSLILGPLLLVILDPLMQKTKHRVFIPKFKSFSRFIYRFRYLFLIVFALLIVPSYIFQSKNTFIYGESSMIGSEGTTYHDDFEKLTSRFGYEQSIVILTNQDLGKENMLYQQLMMDKDILRITSIQSAIPYQGVTLDPAIRMLLESNFYQDGYARMIININAQEESEEAFQVLENIQTITEDIGFNDVYYIGITPATKTIRDVVDLDYFYVTLTALGLIMIVILITFKNWVLPLVLPLVIVTSVFLSMSVPYFLGNSLAFLGYLIVSTILLGATIDYAILFSKRYIELRIEQDKHTAIEHAIEESAPSITTSALIFGIAGLSLTMMSSVQAIAQMGLLIALGALFGMLSVLVLLPQLIFIFDKGIMKAKIDSNIIRIKKK